MRSRRDRLLRGRRLAAPIAALSALVLLTASAQARAEPVVYQSDPATADCTADSADTSGAARRRAEPPTLRDRSPRGTSRRGQRNGRPG